MSTNGTGAPSDSPIPDPPPDAHPLDSPRDPLSAPGLAASQIPAYDPAATLADQIAQVLGEPPAQRDPDQPLVTSTEGFVASDATDPSTTSPTTGEGEGGGDAVSGSPTAPPDPSPDADADSFSLDSLASAIYGRPPTRDEAQAIIQLWHDASRLSPEQKHQLAVTMGYVADTTPPAPTTTPPPAPSTPQSDASTDDIDPYLAPHLTPVQNELTELRTQVQSLVQDRQMTQAETLQAQANAALDAFAAEHAYLTPEEFSALQVRVRDSGIVAAEFSRSNDISSAVSRAMNYELWQDENLRAKALQVQAEQTRAADQEEVQRQQRAASLSPGGSQVSRDDTSTSTAPTPPPMDRWAAREAMTRELAPLFNQS